MISLFLGIGFGLSKEQLKSGVAQVKARPNIVFVLTDEVYPTARCGRASSATTT